MSPPRRAVVGSDGRAGAGFARPSGGVVIAAKSTSTGSSKPRRTRAGVTAPPGPPDPANAAPRTENPDARAFAVEAARALADDRCHQVAVLDVAGLSPVTDVFVVATGSSARQMRTAVDSVEELGRAKGYGKLSRSGDESANWIILDCVDVVVHVFTQDARSYYDVDGLWGDAKRIEWERPNESRLAAGRKADPDDDDE
ncbi:MAG TPA: ribosome silencing factor [Humisphaera sp.]